MKKWLIAAGAGVIVLGIAAYVVSLYLERIVEKSVAATTMMDIRVADVDVGWLTGRVLIRGLDVMNPAGFPVEPLSRIAEVTVDVRPRTLFSKKIEFNELRIHINNVSILKNQVKQINAEVLSEALTTHSDKSSDVKTENLDAVKRDNGRSIHIHRLVLTVDSIRYRDLRSNLDLTIKPQVKEREFRNVENLNTVARVVTAEVLKQAMTDAGMDAILQASLYTLAGPGAILMHTEAGRKVVDAGKNAVKGITSLFGKSKKPE